MGFSVQSLLQLQGMLYYLEIFATFVLLFLFWLHSPLYFQQPIAIQAISGNDQNTSPTNQKTAGSKLNRTN